MSVITSATIETAPSANFAELLRTIPGVNITQVSARDINVTSRAATGTLATGQLALLDGRSLYQDFFGFVMWDFLPVNFNEVKQVEVIRGPASAVWGANALYGVVNVISKTPREMKGTSATFGFGGFDRPDADAGSLWYVSGTHADAPNDRWSYKLSGGGYSQDALARPTGKIPCDIAAVCTVTTTSYPPFANTGTTQPKFDARVDYDYEDGRKLSFSGGVAGNRRHHALGHRPVRHQQRVGDGLRQGELTRRARCAPAFFTNILSGDADQLLTRGLNGAPITFAFDTDDVRLRAVERPDVRASGTSSATAATCASTATICRLRRTPTTARSSASTARTRSSCPTSSALVAGGRVDRFDFVDDFVFSPRVAFLIKPDANQTFRVSYNRAYRSPSVINNFIDFDHLAARRTCRPSAARALTCCRSNVVGNTDLKVQSLDAFEIGYSGVVANGRAIISAAYYMNWLKNDILFTQPTGGVYTAANPPSNWPLPPVVIAAAGAAGRLPAVDLHVSELRQEHEPGPRARRQRLRQPTTRASSPTTRTRPSRIRRTFLCPS